MSQDSTRKINITGTLLGRYLIIYWCCRNCGCCPAWTGGPRTTSQARHRRKQFRGRSGRPHETLLGRGTPGQAGLQRAQKYYSETKQVSLLNYYCTRSFMGTEGRCAITRVNARQRNYVCKETSTFSLGFIRNRPNYFYEFQFFFINTHINN